ncbi:MAG: NAD+ synthase [Acidiferrobacter sp.]
MTVIALGQINCQVGDLEGNAARMVAWADKAHDHGADLVAFPELGLTGYPPEDLLLRQSFVQTAAATLARMATQVRGIDVLVGLPWEADGYLYNAVAWIHEGSVAAVYRKQLLPNYGVFDERRYFTPGTDALVRSVGGVAVGVTICEDLWAPEAAAAAHAAGARFLININASPYHQRKDVQRLEVARARAAETTLPLAYVNMIGGQDELVFDGASFVIAANGQLMATAAAFREELVIVTLDGEGHPQRGRLTPPLPDDASLYGALTVGLADYVRKNGFQRVLLGLSGGVDSALTLALCHDALGSDAVQAVMMPSPYTAQISVEDARAQAAALRIALTVLPIDQTYAGLCAVLAPHWVGAGQAVATENLQARIRGTLLMSIANAHHGLVVITSNKSELAVGYATLYGDLAGGYAPLKDVFKTDVYRLAHYRNRLSPVIPMRVLTRPPSAELRADQQDTDSLPPYDLLDTILREFIEQDRDPEELVASGYDRAVVAQIVALVRQSEHKRRQSPPGTRVSARAFGRDWRYPITALYRDKS